MGRDGGRVPSPFQDGPLQRHQGDEECRRQEAVQEVLRTLMTTMTPPRTSPASSYRDGVFSSLTPPSCFFLDSPRVSQTLFVSTVFPVLCKKKAISIWAQVRFIL